LFRVLKEFYSLKKYFYNLVFRLFIEIFKSSRIHSVSNLYAPCKPFRSRRLLTIYQPNNALFNRKGRGKDHSLKEIIATTHKNTVVVAPTGIAALTNAGGVTIHSMFQLPFGGFIPAFGVDSQFTDTVKFESKDLRRHFKMSGLKKSVIRNMELLVIDEVVCSVLIAGRHGLHDANSA
jgi:hypothetical protein